VSSSKLPSDTQALLASTCHETAQPPKRILNISLTCPFRRKDGANPHGVPKRRRLALARIVLITTLCGATPRLSGIGLSHEGTSHAGKRARIVEMVTGLGTMRHPGTKALHAYWLELKKERACPTRGEIEPRAIKNILSNIFLMEWIDRDIVLFRIAGTKLCAAFDREFRGMNALTMMQGDSRRMLRTLIDNVVMTPCPGLMIAEAETLSGAKLECEILFLPLANDRGEIRKVIGTAHAPGGRGQLRGEKLARLNVKHIRLMNEDGNLVAPQVAPPYPADLIEQEIPVLRAKRHLRLVVSQEAPLIG
jgi:hypothetical protein